MLIMFCCEPGQEPGQVMDIGLDPPPLHSPPNRKIFPLSMLSLGQTGFVSVWIITFLTQVPSRSLTRPSPQSWSDMAALVRLARPEKKTRRASSEAVAAAATPAASVPAKAPLAAPPIDEAGWWWWPWPPFVVWIFGRLKDGEILAIFGNSAACLLKPDAILLILMFMEPLAV